MRYDQTKPPALFIQIISKIKIQMPTTQNPQMTEVLVNLSSKRIATNNDKIKYYISLLVKESIDSNVGMDELLITIDLLRQEIKINEEQGGTQHGPKHAGAVADKFNVELRRAFIPTEKYILA